MPIEFYCASLYIASSILNIASTALYIASATLNIASDLFTCPTDKEADAGSNAWILIQWMLGRQVNSTHVNHS